MVKSQLEQADLFWIAADHEWDDFGTTTEIPPELEDDDLYARPLVIWKKISFIDFVQRLVRFAYKAEKFGSNPDVIFGAALAISALNLFPMSIKIVMENEHAAAFVNLICESDDGDQYLREDDLEDFPEVSPLIDFYVQKKLLLRKDGCLFVQGKVLRSATLWGT